MFEKHILRLWYDNDNDNDNENDNDNSLLNQ